MITVYSERPQSPDKVWLDEFDEVIETDFALIKISVELPASKEYILDKAKEKNYPATVSQRSNKFFITIQGPKWQTV